MEQTRRAAQVMEQRAAGITAEPAAQRRPHHRVSGSPQQLAAAALTCMVTQTAQEHSVSVLHAVT